MQRILQNVESALLFCAKYIPYLKAAKFLKIMFSKAGDARTASSGQVLLNGLAKENGPSKEENPFKATTTPSVPFGWNKEQSSPSKPPVPAFLQQNNFSFGQSKAAAPFSFGQATHSKGEKRKGEQ